MYPLRSFLVLCLFFFGLSFVGEFVLGPLMGDDVPFWKISAVSLITAIGSTIPLQKRGLRPGDIFKYFKRSYIVQDFKIAHLIPELRTQFPEHLFNFRFDEKRDRIYISRKANWRSFGEVLKLEFEEGELRLSIRPKYYIDLLDQGQAHESLLKLEEIIQTYTA
ncbi:MAG: hypothetical protein ACPGVV_01100 [Croceimicrobium sp.]|nr:hypothetical protein [Bacteroidota bacterium]